MRDPLFATPPAGLDAVSWLVAGFRALHPLRWGLALAGLAATVTVAAMFQALFEGQAPGFADWFSEPAAQTQALGAHLTGRSTLGLAIRLGAVLAVVAGIWSIVGGWIARHELLARYRGQPYATAERIEPGPMGLVTRRLKDLVVSCPVVLCICAALLLPVALAGGINHLGGIGAILVAVLLPVLLVADLILLCVAAGLAAWPLMPVTLAAENSDVFDALSRAYNYAYQRPVRFVLVTAAAVAATSLPTAAALLAVAGPVENWLAASGHPVVWAAAGLSSSAFWSLQTLVYLHLRTAVDETDANEIAREVEPTSSAPPEAAQPPTAATGAKPAPHSDLITHVFIFAGMVATWVMTAKLFTRFGGETAGWLGWGVGENFRPPADGLYWLASIVAAIWGAIWVAAPIVVAVRQMVRTDPRDAAAAPPAEVQPNRS
jgi:hypothetical protein